MARSTILLLTLTAASVLVVLLSTKSSILGTPVKFVTTDNAKNVSFDFYVMAMSYQPEFCYQHRREDFVGCHNYLDYWKGHLTIHGLWPQFADGSWPSTCSNEPFHNSTVIDVGSDLYKLWPNVKVNKANVEYYDFWQHEWTKHGTCSGLSQDDYFEAALREFVDTPSLVLDNYGGILSKQDLLEAYGGGVVLVCAHGRYLEEVRACLALHKDNGMPTNRIPCPDVVMEEDSCGSEIAITTFPPRELRTSMD